MVTAATVVTAGPSEACWTLVILAADRVLHRHWPRRGLVVAGQLGLWTEDRAHVWMKTTEDTCEAVDRGQKIRVGLWTEDKREAVDRGQKIRVGLWTEDKREAMDRGQKIRVRLWTEDKREVVDRGHV